MTNAKSVPLPKKVSKAKKGKKRPKINVTKECDEIEMKKKNSNPPATIAKIPSLSE